MKFLRNRTAIGFIVIIMAFALCFGVAPAMSDSMNSKITVVKIKADVPKGQIITQDKIETTDVVQSMVPANCLVDKTKVVGKYATADLFSGDFVTPSKVSDQASANDSYLYGLNGQKQAMSITIKNFAAGLSGKLLKGDIITLIATDVGDDNETIHPMELRYVEVLAATTEKGEDKKDGEVKKKEGEEVDMPSTITLLVSPEQAIKLAELESNATVHVGLVYRGQKDKADKFITEQDRLLLSEPPTEIPKKGVSSRKGDK